jgi:periplasmic protein TonB
MRYTFAIILSLIFTFVASPANAQVKKNGQNVIKNSDGTTSSGKTKKYNKTGMWITKTAQGELVRETEYKNDQKDGTEKEYFPNGSIKSIIRYTNGTKNGECIRFNAKGDTTVVCNYLDNMLHGEYIENIQSYYKNGTLKGTYNLGRKEGLWIENTIRIQNSKDVDLDSTWFAKDRMDGRSVLYVNGKLIRSGNYSQGREEGEQRAYYLTKPEQIQFITYYKAGRKNGPSFSYYVSGNIMSVMHYSEGRKNGCDTTWFDKTRSIMNTICYYESGLPQYSREYSENGKLKSRVYYSNKHYKADSSFLYNENGQLFYEWHSKTGEGVQSIEYYPNGKVKAQGDYILEKKNGLWVYYDSTGKKTKEKNYVRNSVSGWYVDYYPNGKVRYKAKCNYGIPRDSVYAFDSKGKNLPKDSKEFKTIQDDIVKNDREISLTPIETDWIVDAIDGDYDAVEVAEAPAPTEDEIYSFVEEMPEFPGGQDSLNSYLRRNIKYPQFEKEQGKQGTVYMSFVVRKDGSITDVKVLKEVPGAPGFTKEAARVINAMPIWKPGKMNGRPVNTNLTIPIKFSLKN